MSQGWRWEAFEHLGLDLGEHGGLGRHWEGHEELG